MTFKSFFSFHFRLNFLGNRFLRKLLLEKENNFNLVGR